MLRTGTMCVFCLALSSHLAGQENTPKPQAGPELKTTAQQASYGIGLTIGKNLRSEGLEIDVPALAQGIKDALTSAEPRLSQAEISAALTAFQQAMQAQNLDRRKLVGEKNKREGAAFLTANKAKEGVVALPSGLQYQILKEGTGPSPKASDTVRTHYHGTLIDGKVFDSSVERNEPVSFPVGGVIRGWTEALQLMKVGSKWRLFVPSELAYGPQGAGADIGPNAVLIFDVELLGIE